MYTPDDMDISDTLHPLDRILRELRRQQNMANLCDKLDPGDSIIQGRPERTGGHRLQDIRDLIAGPSMPEAYETHPSWMALRECDKRRARAIDGLSQPVVKEPELPEDPYYSIKPPPPPFCMSQFDDCGLRPWQ